MKYDCSTEPINTQAADRDELTFTEKRVKPGDGMTERMVEQEEKEECLLNFSLIILKQ